MATKPKAKATDDRSPKALALADLARSGLDAADAKALRLEALTAEQTAKLDESFKRAAALKLPYFDLEGKPTGFFRLRYLELNGFDRHAKHQQRYTQLHGTAPEIYLPPLGGFDWRALAKATDRSLLITEGEKKAAAATKAGFPTIGLGGVWSWRSKKLGLGLLPILKTGFDWAGRTVYLVFDSDFRTNPNVMQALVALAAELGGLGAKVRLALLPAADDRKVALDDYLVAHGPKALGKFLLESEPFSLVDELWKLNGEVVYVRNPGLIVVLEDGRKLSPSAFKEHAYANRYYYERTTNAKGEERLTKKPIAPAWLGWERRSELERITYAPGEARIVGRGYNYWAGWGVEPARHADVKLWHELLGYVFEGNAAAQRWFEAWLAYPLQHPGAKLYAAAVLWGPTHGTGKSLIGYTLGKIYGSNFVEISDQDLAASFNEWVENKQFVMGDDVTSAEYKRALMEKLKHMITRHTLRVNAKYLPTYEVPDRVNYYFTANSPTAFLVDDTDRRYFIWRVPDTPKARDFYDEYDAKLHHGPLPAAVFRHLLDLDLSDFNPRAKALETAAKREMVLDSKTEIGAWVAELKEAPDAVLRIGGVEAPGDLFTTSTLLNLYDPAGSKRVSTVWLGRELKAAGFRQVNEGAVVATARGPQRLYAIRNAERWLRAKPTELAEHYNATQGKTGEPEPKKDKF